MRRWWRVLSAALRPSPLTLAPRAAAKHFRTTVAWQEKITPLLRDDLVERLFRDSIEPLRTGAVFHFLEEFFEPVLSEGQFQDVVVISGVGTPQGNVHYEFSDLMAFALLAARPSQPMSILPSSRL